MDPFDFVYEQVYKGALNKGVKEGIARDQAVIALDAYKKGKFSGAKVGKFIEDQIKVAKMKSKKVK